MILVGQYDSPFVRRVAITLHHYGIPFGRNAISVFGDAEQMAKINPLVRIPSLMLESGEVLIDSGAILDHLDELVGPERALMPRAGADRRRVLQLTAVACGTVEKLGNFVYERTFHGPGEVSEAWLERCRGQFRGGLSFLENQLSSEWLALGRFTQADVSTGAMLGYVTLRVPEVDLVRDYPKLAAFSARCEQLAAFAAAGPAANEVMPAARG